MRRMMILVVLFPRCYIHLMLWNVSGLHARYLRAFVHFPSFFTSLICFLCFVFLKKNFIYFSWSSFDIRILQSPVMLVLWCYINPFSALHSLICSQDICLYPPSVLRDSVKYEFACHSMIVLNFRSHLSDFLVLWFWESSTDDDNAWTHLDTTKIYRRLNWMAGGRQAIVSNLGKWMDG